MGLLGIFWHCLVALLDFMGAKHNWVKEEVESKPRSDVV
jgi:hypothetical protein